MLLKYIVEMFLGAVIISAFVPVFKALGAEYELIQIICEFIRRSF